MTQPTRISTSLKKQEALTKTIPLPTLDMAWLYPLSRKVELGMMESVWFWNFDGVSASI